MTTVQPDDGRTMRERMLAGDLYIADDPELAEALVVAQERMAAYNASSPRDASGRRALLEQLLGTVGEGVEVRPPVYVDYGTSITIGARSFVNYGLVALDVASITIGEDVQIGPHVQLLTPTHPVEAGPRRDKWEAAKPIVIGDNVWLGGGVIVLPGVRIGANTVVGAGSVVTKDLPPDVIAVGNPARSSARSTRPDRRAGALRAGPGDAQPQVSQTPVAGRAVKQVAQMATGRSSRDVARFGAAADARGARGARGARVVVGDARRADAGSVTSKPRLLSRPVACRSPWNSSCRASRPVANLCATPRIARAS